MERRLAAILVADVVGYSRLMEANETATHTVLKERRTNVLEPLIPKHNGRIIKFMGDGALLEFSSPVNAVNYAVELQRDMAAANSGLAEDKRITLRVGINLGDVIVEDGDLYGDGVNVAARLEAMADPGCIFISDTVYTHVKGKIDQFFEDLGEKELRNFAEPVRIYRVSEAASRSSPVRAVRAKNAQDHTSIAVLPFDNMSGDAEQAYFSDGITEDIITELSRFKELQVIARNSSFQFRGRATDIKDVAQKLDVQFVVEGSVRKTGNRIRVTAQLIDTLSATHVWAEHYDRELTDVFQIQDEISRAIAVRVAGLSHTVLAQRSRGRPTSSLTAYDNYLRGVDCYSHDSAERLAACRGYFEEAAKLDPGFARAWGYMAYTTMRGVIHGWSAPGDRKKALDYAKRAVRLDPYDYYNHWDMGFVLWNNRSFDQAMDEYRRAVTLNPNDADLLAEMGDTLVYWGEAEEGIAHLKRAMLVNPLFPDWYRWNMGFALFSAGAYGESLEELAKISDPHSNVRLIAAADNVRLGRLPEAQRIVKDFLREEPGYTLEMLRMRTAFKHLEDDERWISTLRDAGLPD